MCKCDFCKESVSKDEAILYKIFIPDNQFPSEDSIPYYACQTCDYNQFNTSNQYRLNRINVIELAVELFEKGMYYFVDYLTMDEHDEPELHGYNPFSQYLLFENISSMPSSRLADKSDEYKILLEELKQKNRDLNAEPFICVLCGQTYTKKEPAGHGVAIAEGPLCDKCYNEELDYINEMNVEIRKDIGEEEFNLGQYYEEIETLEKDISNLEKYNEIVESKPHTKIKNLDNTPINLLNQSEVDNFLFTLRLRENELYRKINQYKDKKERLLKSVGKRTRAEMVEEQATQEIKHRYIDFDPVEMKELIDKVVIGQEDTKKQLITEFYKFYTLGREKNNLLLVGPSGTGKTFLVRTLVKLLEAYNAEKTPWLKNDDERSKIPFMEIDIQHFTPTGYKGREVTQMFNPLIIQYGADMDKLSGAVIFIDEIDKTATTWSKDGDPKKLQQNLLKIIEGDKIPFNVGIGDKRYHGIVDTSKFIFVAAGACVGLNDIRKKRLQDGKSNSKKNIGFKIQSDDSSHNKIENFKKYTPEDLIEFGFIPELLGRFSIISELHSLKLDDWVKFLKSNDNSPLKEAEEICKAMDVEFSYTNELIHELANKCNNHPLGVRGVRNEFLSEFNQYLFDGFYGKKKIRLIKLTSINN